MVAAPGTPASRVCGTCGRPAAPHEFFCHRCTTRLPDPTEQDAVEVWARSRAAYEPRPEDRGWQVLVTVVATVVVVGVLVAVAVVGVARLDLFAPDPTPPGAVATAYVEAAADDDCARAVALMVERPGARGVCATTVREVGRAATGVGADDIAVADVLVVDDRATVKVEVTVREDLRRSFLLELDLREDRWLVDQVFSQGTTPLS